MRIRRRLLYFLSALLYSLAQILYRTLKVKVVYHPDYQETKQYLAAIWHGKMFLPIFIGRRHQTKMAILVSPSKDGDVICELLNKLGYEAIRGSSRKNNVASLAEMLRKLKAGYSIGVVVDGPLGPIHQVKPGIVHMAQKLNVEILPFTASFQRKWVFTNAWDRFELPKPFSLAIFYAGKPLSVPEEADSRVYAEVIEKALFEAQKRADELLAHHHSSSSSKWLS